MTRDRHQVESGRGRRVEVVVGVVSGIICLAALFALLRLVLAVQDAYAYSQNGGIAREMTVTYAGLEAPLARSHPGMPAPGRLCLVALDDGTTTYTARMDGRACGVLQAGHTASVQTWHGRVIGVEGWPTGDEPQGEVLAWVVATVMLGCPALLLTRLAVRGAGARRPRWYFEHLDQ
jgi:hypothetical protein